MTESDENTTFTDGPGSRSAPNPSSVGRHLQKRVVVGAVALGSAAVGVWSGAAGLNDGEPFGLIVVVFLLVLSLVLMLDRVNAVIGSNAGGRRLLTLAGIALAMFPYGVLIGSIITG